MTKHVKERRLARPLAKSPRAYHSSAKTGGRDDWRTPAKIIDLLRAAWPIGLDPCASSHAVYHLAEVNLDVKCDGLSIPWAPIVRGTGGVTFANWPYSASESWSAKMIAEAAAGCPIIALCAARPGAQWYRALKAAADALGEVHGRLIFLSGKPPPPPVVPLVDTLPPRRRRRAPKRTESAPFPSALFGVNVSWRRFFAAFHSIATCEVPR